MFNIIIQNALAYFWIWITIMIAILVHEFGHFITAIACKVKVETFSLGFGNKTLWRKKKWGINWQITPFLFGGFVKLYGENEKKKRKGFLAQRYLNKLLILLAGVTMNFLVACICYLIAYKSINTGLFIDLSLVKFIFIKDEQIIYNLMTIYQLNSFIVQLSMINLLCAITNIMPFPCLDGSQIWLVLTEKLFKKKQNFEIFMFWVNKIGFWVLMTIQIILIYYIWSKR